MTPPFPGSSHCKLSAAAAYLTTLPGSGVADAMLPDREGCLGGNLELMADMQPLAGTRWVEGQGKRVRARGSGQGFGGLGRDAQEHAACISGSLAGALALTSSAFGFPIAPALFGPGALLAGAFASNLSVQQNANKLA